MEVKLNIENLSDEERKQLMALVEKANNPKNKVWKPEIGDVYYFLSNDGMAIIINWNNSTSDIARWDVGNVFRTEEEAREEAERRKTLTKWKRLSIESGENENEWNGNNRHWYCYYDYSDNKMDISLYTVSKEGSTYFSTKESLLNAIAEIGEDNVKKYILNIKE